MFTSSRIFAYIFLVQEFLIVSCFCLLPVVQSKSIHDFDYSSSRTEILDVDGKYVVEWEIHFETNMATFHVTAETTGFVGFGISNQGGMTGADIVIGGVWPNGTAYFQDYHGLGNFEPVNDSRQDWSLVAAHENSTHTELWFQRLLNTCDEEDTPITNDTTRLIWSLGQTDQISYHGVRRGSAAVNILDPPMPEFDFSNFQTWSLHRSMVMPALDTSYWCTVHKMPGFKPKQHVVGFAAHLPSNEALKHVHHFTIYKCKAPSGINPSELFQPYIGQVGGDCYDAQPKVPVEYCGSILYVWATGGKPLIFPDHVGYPVGEFEDQDEYVIFEIHYDNPQVLAGVWFEAGVEVYHTEQLRPFEATLIVIGHTLTPSHLIPPKSVNYTTVGHCSSECTAANFPPDGIRLFSVLLHSHLSGRKLKLRHFRNGAELPWISVDDNYDFDYQQSRPLRKEIRILPGDQLSYECVTDSTWTDGVVLAGLSTRHEMCQVFVWAYPRTTMEACESHYYNFTKLFGRFGVEEVDWSNRFNPTILSPPNLSNKSFNDALNQLDSSFWTSELRNEIELDLRFSEHVGTCSSKVRLGRPGVLRNEDWQKLDDLFVPGRVASFNREKIGAEFSGKGFVGYPKVDEEYAPPNECHNN